jgi:RNA polymerase sigma-70 factor (ECF subfamily)
MPDPSLADLEAFYRAHSPWIYRLCLRLAGHSPDAEDWTQEVLLDTFTKRESFRGDSDIKTWLYRCTVRHVLRAIRRRREPHLPANSGIGSAASPLEDLIREETRRAVRNAITLLPLNHRICIILRDWEDLSYLQIAAALEVPVGTVMTWLYRARLQLMELLKSEINGSPADSNSVTT